MLADSLNKSMRGRAILLRISQSLNFYDANLKKITNENMHMIQFMQKVATKRKEKFQREEQEEVDLDWLILI